MRCGIRGVPAMPVLFQTLMIATWVPHIAFVLLTLGAATLSSSPSIGGTRTYWERLSIALTKVTKVGVSLLIVLGVAPLLFTQVIYDPQWYASNVLSARWAIAFIFTLIIGYCLWFAFYWGNHEGAKAQRRPLCVRRLFLPSEWTGVSRLVLSGHKPGKLDGMVRTRRCRRYKRCDAACDAVVTVSFHHEPFGAGSRLVSDRLLRLSLGPPQTSQRIT